MGVDVRMFARVKEENALSKKEVLDLSWRICEALYHDTFWVSRDGGLEGHALFIHKPEEWDEPVVGLGADQLIEVNSICRYYGEGYERGPIMDFINIAEWLEFNLPKGSQIYYGGDSSDHTELFDKPRRTELFKHFATYGHTPYTGMRTVLKRDKSSKWCDFCEHAMLQ